MSCSSDLVIDKGATFRRVLRWEASPVIYKTITNITTAAPAVITAPSHGVPEGWRVAITAVQGMKQINARFANPRSSDYHQATVLTTDTIALNDVNAAVFDDYVSGGVLQYNTPVDLTAFTARMAIRYRVGGSEIITLTTDNSGITIDPAEYTITLLLTAEETAAITATHGVYDLEMVSDDAVVTRLISGKIKFTEEVTT